MQVVFVSGRLRTFFRPALHYERQHAYLSNSARGNTVIPSKPKSIRQYQTFPDQVGYDESDHDEYADFGWYPSRLRHLLDPRRTRALSIVGARPKFDTDDSSVTEAPLVSGFTDALGESKIARRSRFTTTTGAGRTKLNESSHSPELTKSSS